MCLGRNGRARQIRTERMQGNRQGGAVKDLVEGMIKGKFADTWPSFLDQVRSGITRAEPTIRNRSGERTVSLC